MIIKVTQEHIDKGKKANGYYCPVSLAIRETMPLTVVNTGCIKIYIYNKTDLDLVKLIKCVATPSRIADFINDFDKGYKVKPIEFELE